MKKGNNTNTKFIIILLSILFLINIINLIIINKKNSNQYMREGFVYLENDNYNYNYNDNNDNNDENNNLTCPEWKREIRSKNDGCLLCLVDTEDSRKYCKSGEEKKLNEVTCSENILRCEDKKSRKETCETDKECLGKCNDFKCTGLEEGKLCKQDKDCEYDNCVFGKCIKPKRLNESCSLDKECLSNKCKNDVCFENDNSLMAIIIIMIIILSIYLLIGLKKFFKNERTIKNFFILVFAWPLKSFLVLDKSSSNKSSKNNKLPQP